MGLSLHLRQGGADMEPGAWVAAAKAVLSVLEQSEPVSARVLLWAVSLEVGPGLETILRCPPILGQVPLDGQFFPLPPDLFRLVRAKGCMLQHHTHIAKTNVTRTCRRAEQCL